MSKRKGVSAEEKRIRMLQLFHEKKDFFQLKELEKIAPKEKGIVVQSVKEIVQNLVDDNLVRSEKIGTSVYFWSFPSDAKHAKKLKLAELGKNIGATKSKLEKSLKSISQLEAGREDNEEREKLLEQNDKLSKERDRLQIEIKKYCGHDPEVYRKKENEIEIAKEAANRWTDNIFSVKSWCKNKFNVEDSILDKQFGIPSELDYVD
uniref:Meiotic nuclear division protein 1 homolog n=1 Tax=Lygus hesperus TaxID=30085 RepID=A0A0A9XLK5_LYGHE